MQGELNLNVHWELIKFKMKNMKTSYKKALDWRNSTGAGVEDEDGNATVDGKFDELRILSFFNVFYFHFSREDSINVSFF